MTRWLEGTLIMVLVFLALTAQGTGADPEKRADRYAQAYQAYESAPIPIPADEIQHYVYFARDREAIHDHPFLNHPRFAGAQIMYSWAELEPARDRYDFSNLRADLDYLKSRDRKLFVQLQDATFSPSYKAVPAYLQTAEFGEGIVPQRADDGTVEGWVARRWDPRVRERFARLLDALGRELDGKIAGINLQESSIGVRSETDPSFTPAGYAGALMENITALKRAFPTSVTMQYANFMPGEWLPWEDHGYLRAVFAHAEKTGVGLGAPDLMVRRRGQLNHVLALMHEGTFSVPLGIAVQDGNYIGQTNTLQVTAQRKNIVPLLHGFAQDFLRVNFMFWGNQEPCFTEDVLPAFTPAPEKQRH